MIIVSQNREEILNFNNVMNIEICNCNEDGFGIFAGVIIGVDDNYRLLGYYSKESRAREVLEEIMIAYANMEMLKVPKININQIITAAEMTRNICYKMPRE